MVVDGPKLSVDGPEFPATLMIGEFTLDVEEIVDAGVWDEAAKVFGGAAGTAWLRFDCGGAPLRAIESRLRPGLRRLRHSLEVVARVVHPQSQISLVEAQRVRPDVCVGESLTLDVAVTRPELQEIVQHGTGVPGWLEVTPRKGDVLVEFGEATVQLQEGNAAIGRIVKGGAAYPAKRVIPSVIEREIAGFTLLIASLRLSAGGARGLVTVRLPSSIASPDSCHPATLDLGQVHLTPACELYIDAPDETYGPWLVGDTGMLIEGTGYVLDLSTTTSPAGRAPGWQGLQLGSGEASGETLVPDPCNTGYLRGHYGLADGSIVQDGLDALLTLQGAFQFSALNPRGDELTLRSGWLQMNESEIVAGEFGAGVIELSRFAVCKSTAGSQVAVDVVVLWVQPNLDLAGAVDHHGGRISWGELTHPGDEVIAWTGSFNEGYLYLPAGAVPSYCPESGGAFTGPSLSSVIDASLTELAAKAVAGVTFARLPGADIFSPDRPGGVGNPFTLSHVEGWLRIGSLGVDGDLSTYNRLIKQELGDPARAGYVGVQPFEADLFVTERKNQVAQFVTSAVFDSDFAGRFTIPPPCDIPALGFGHMQLTSTAHLVGGDVALPPGGVPLDYWEVQLVPVGAPSAAGVVSARTGRIVFLAAGIAEPRHFATAFGLTWGELLADGDLGELYLDFNQFGQRFDGLSFSPHRFRLSTYAAGTADPYLAVCGPIHFPFFGPGYVNIRDARDANTAAPYLSRNVTVPKTSIVAGGQATDLALQATWKDIVSSDLALFECPDAQVDYNTGAQDGFLGTGTGEVACFHSVALDIKVEIHSDATDIRVSSAVTHDLVPPGFAHLSGISDISGCVRITGPLLTRMSFYGILETSSQVGAMLGPKAGFAAEIAINVTPAALDFYASGDMLLSVATVDLELSASAHLLFDFAMGSAEGELVGRIDCDAAIAGLAGEGQVTWHVGPGMHYLQGRMKVSVCDSLVGGGLEGGFFVGHQVPTALAWVLKPTNPRFGVSAAILPPLLTGVFGYGQVSFAVTLYVLGGGVDLYAGMGAFTIVPPGLSSAFPVPGVAPPLPYAIGACGISAHGEILGGLVSASAWANLTLLGPVPFFVGTIGLEGCVLWVVCASVDLTATLDGTGFHLS
jgi:hypothetical protein